MFTRDLESRPESAMTGDLDSRLATKEWRLRRRCAGQSPAGWSRTRYRDSTIPPGQPAPRPARDGMTSSRRPSLSERFCAVSAYLADRHRFVGEIKPSGPGHRIAREVPLQRVVVEGVVERRHDHRLVEDQSPMADRAGRGVDRVVEATVGAVDARIPAAYGLDVRVGL